MISRGSYLCNVAIYFLPISFQSSALVLVGRNASSRGLGYHRLKSDVSVTIGGRLYWMKLFGFVSCRKPATVCGISAFYTELVLSRVMQICDVTECTRVNLHRTCFLRIGPALRAAGNSKRDAPIRTQAQEKTLHL